MRPKSPSCRPQAPRLAASTGSHGIGFGGLDAKLRVFWAFVGIPIAWGVWVTLVTAVKIF